MTSFWPSSSSFQGSYESIDGVLYVYLRRLAGVLVYKKIRDALGIKKVAVSGGGSLAAHLDDFYETIGLDVVNGWGLTEVAHVHTSHTPLSAHIHTQVHAHPDPRTCMCAHTHTRKREGGCGAKQEVSRE
jgi:long-subunit acyl-CoA synthetase (AMP-forming)